MAQSYDVSLKVLFALPGDGIIRRRVFGSRVVEYLPTEMPQVSNRRADLVAITEDGRYHHVEFISRNEYGFVYRMYYYSGEVMLRYRQPVHQAGLYVGRDPMRIENELETEDIHYRFPLIDVREMDGVTLAASSDWADRALAMLARGDSQRAIAAAVSSIADLPGPEQNQLAAVLLILSGIIEKEQVVQEALQEIGMIDIMENKVLGPMIEHARNQGMEKGLEKGMERGMERGRAEMQSLLSDQLAEKFGRLPAWATTRIEGASMAELRSWGKRILHTDSLEQVLQ